MAFCPSCGKAYEGNLSFCPNCGRALPGGTQPAQTSQPVQQSAPPVQPATRKTSTATWVVVGLVVIVVVIVAAFALSGGAGLGSPQTVPVSGYVTTGFGTHPTSIEFTSDTGAIYYGTVSITNQNSESYSAALPNGHVYSVLVLTAGSLGYTGSCNAGTLSVNQGAGSGNLLENFNC